MRILESCAKRRRPKVRELGEVVKILMVWHKNQKGFYQEKDQANIAWFTSTREKLWIEGNYSTLMNKWYNEKLLLNSLCYFSWWKPFSITFFESSQVTPRPLSSFTYELSIVKYEKVFRLLLYDFVCRLNQTELNVKSWSHKFRESYPILSDLI